MKRLTFTILFFAAVLCGRGQTIDFGVKAGLNLAIQNHDGISFGHSMLAGFNAGGIMDVSFKNFSIQPGLIFSIKGEADTYKYNDINPFNGGSYLPSKTYLDYVEMPVNFLYKADPINGTSLHFGGGPYLGIGISETDIVNNNTYSSHKFSYSNPDLGLGLIVGVTLKSRLLVDGGFEYSLLNIDNNSYTTKNSVISISAGYLFK